MHTVIAAFQNRDQAQRAADLLVQRGFDRSDVHVEHQQGSTGGSSQPPQQPQQREPKGFFASLFSSDDDYQQHGAGWDRAVAGGRCVVIADVEDTQEAQKAVSCLHEAGAVDVDDHQARQGDRASAAQPRAAAAGTPRGTLSGTGKDGALEVVQEEMKVGKRTLEQGGVRVVQRLSEKPVREVVRLREEHAVVERRPVDRTIDGGMGDAFREGSMEVRESAEQAVVAKRAHVVEEVRLGKQVTEREEVIEDRLRRKDVDVERLDAGGQRERERAVAADKRVPQAGTREPGTGTPGMPRTDKDRPL